MRKQLFKNLTLIDVVGQTVMPNCYFVTEDERFQSVGTVQQLPSDFSEAQFDSVLDLNEKFVMPGLFNCHIHCLSTPIGHPVSINYESAAKFAIRGMTHLQQHLKSGVVFVRDMNGRKLVEVELKDALRMGLFEGPDLHICRQSLCMTGGHGWSMGRECDGVDDTMRAAREQLRGGADFIKIMATGGIMADGEGPGQEQLTEPEIRAAVEVAHRAGKKTATHAQGTSGIKNALRAGIDSIEHGIMLDDEAIELMLKNKVTFVPTLTCMSMILKHGVAGGVPAFAVEKAKIFRERHLQSFAMARKAGVKIGVGTDAGTPYALHSETYQELVQMVQAGMTPMEAIASATIRSAEVCGVESILGSITVGKKASFLVLEEDPLRDISTLRQVSSVYKDAKCVTLSL